ncbi:hypothetical protein MKW94_007217 [Papaver nudicaule]|uniref:Uncharacterized protein n=1 Tax=Papaver nudicaule TaxID=74823 RepID=A0AA41RUX8_PAPNU|nr:hypothetical protein [Papaver nudicaule]
MDRRRNPNEGVIVEHTVEFEKGKLTDIAVSEYDDHYTKDTVFGITDIHLHNMPSGDPVITVWGGFRKPYEHLAKDPVSGLERPIFFVVGDILVPAKCTALYEYQGLLLPNLPGDVDFFVSLNGMKPASQVMKFTFPKTKKSEIRTELEEKLAKLLVIDEKNRKKLLRKLKQCDNKNTHSERVLREYLKNWLFDCSRKVNTTNREGHQVIHHFAGLGYAWAIAIFKRFGFTFNAKHETGWTPLHWAAYYGHKGAATALLIGKADPTLVTTATSDNPSGHTAADLAFDQGHSHLSAYLEDFIKHPEKRASHLLTL